MDIHELRLGNYVNGMSVSNAETIEYFENSKVQAIDGVYCKLQNRLFPIDYINPMPLTEEFLIKLGFQNDGGYWNIQLEVNLNLFYYINPKQKDMQYCGMANKNANVDLHRFPHIKYVHQLQNLYFIWKNKELTFQS